MAFPFILIGTNSIVIYLCSEGLVDFAHTGNYVFGQLNPERVEFTTTLYHLSLEKEEFCYRHRPEPGKMSSDTASARPAPGKGYDQNNISG